MSLKFKPPKNKINYSIHNSPIKKNVARWQWYLIALIIVSPLLYFLWFIFSNYWFISAKGYISLQTYTIRSPENAYIKKVHVQPGQSVQPGIILITLDSPQLNEELKSLGQQLSKVTHLQKSFSNNQLDYLYKMKAQSEHHVRQSKKNYVDFESYYKKGILTVMDLQTAQQNLHDAQIELYNIEKLIEQSKNNHDIDNENSYLQEIRLITAQINIIKKRIENLSITAHSIGAINQLYVHEKDFVSQGQLLLSVSTYKNVNFTAYLKPKFLDYVYQGKQVCIVFPNGGKITGVVENKPSFAKTDTTFISPFKDDSSKVVLIIKPSVEIPLDYQLSGLPVTVEFSGAC